MLSSKLGLRWWREIISFMPKEGIRNDLLYLLQTYSLNLMKKTFVILSVFILHCISPCVAQEKQYKASLDSLNKYINLSAKGTKLLTWYAPGMYNEMAEVFDSSNYYGMTYNNKTKIVISTGNPLYMFNLPLMDTSSIKIDRRGGLIIRDIDSSRCMYHSAESRIFNGKYGGVPIDEVRLFENNTINALYLNKIIFYFKQAIVYSKKVKVKKKDLVKYEY